MIAKRVMRGNAGSFRKLGGYILNPAKLGGQSEWRRTSGYILDIAGGGARTEGVRISNCQSDELDWAIREIETTQAMNTRARGERTYHLVVSFPPGERPEPDQLRDIEDELCRAIGLRAHQRLSAIHTDTQHLHIHIAINQVHPHTFACIEPWYDKRKLMAACQALEKKHGLQSIHNRSERKRPVPPRAADMERRTGIRSFAGWIEDEVKPEIGAALRDVCDWQGVHAALACYGLEIRPRGAGLTIRPVDGRIGVKASRVHEALSKKALTTRFGEFAPPDPAKERPHPSKSYRRRSMQTGDDVEYLWTAYQCEKTETGERRRAAYSELNEWFAERQQGLDRYYASYCNSIYNTDALTGLGRQAEHGKLKNTVAKERQELREQAAKRRAQIQQASATPNWTAYLRRCAEAGDAKAASLLRSQRDGLERAVAAWASGETDPAIRTLINRELRPSVHDDGKTDYRFRDGGSVRIENNQCSVTTGSAMSLYFYLKFHLATAPDQPLRYAASPEWVALTVLSSVVYQLPIRFADDQQECDREALEEFLEGNADRRAALRFVLEHAIAEMPRVEPQTYRLWTPGAAGKGELLKITVLDDGTQAALLKLGDVIHVKPCTAETAATLADAVGQKVRVGADGAIATDTRRWWTR